MERMLFYAPARHVRALCYGGRTVLRVEALLPGESHAAAVHVRALAEALFLYAERTLLPLAAEALKRARREGRGHRFSPHRYTLTLRARPVGRFAYVELSTLYRGEGDLRVERVLRMRWSADGTRQLSLPFWWKKRKEF